MIATPTSFILTIQRLLFLFSGVVQAQTGSNINDFDGQTFDYVIVGGGTAGLTLASRLSEDATVQVAVIEAGDFYERTTGNQSEIPANDKLYNGKSPKDTGLEDWDFTTTPQTGINDEVVHYARGKALGGSSALNYMGYQRTAVGALQRWADEVGDTSYTFEQVFKYYEKSVNFTPPDMSKRIANATPEYAPSTLPQGGLLDVGYPNYAQAFSTWAAEAFEANGMPHVPGFTTGALNGSAWLINTINHTTGFRASSEEAFLRPFLQRPNLVVFANALAEKVLFEGTVAKGVQASSISNSSSTRTNSSTCIMACKEVIVSSGPFQSPQFLMISGVGPKDVLSQHGIDVVADRPGVGQSMNDHIFVGITHRVNVQTSSALAYGNAMEEAIELFDTQQDGLLSNPGGDYASFEKIPQNLRSNFTTSAISDLATFPPDWPEITFYIIPAFVGDFQNPALVEPTDGYQYTTIMCTFIAPLSRGNISISSPSMHDQPLINPNWLTNTTDQQVAIAGFKRLRQIWSTPVLQPVEIGPEYYPGLNVTTDEEILDAVKTSFNTMYHASSTCKMGQASDPMAVVDSKGKVFGVENLRVVDASAFPFLPPGLPMGTVYMLAEKIADSIKNGY